jgi:hypothetical protein
MAEFYGVSLEMYLNGQKESLVETSTETTA